MSILLLGAGKGGAAGVALAPIVITSSATFSVAENLTAVATLTASGGTGSFTWTKTGGADAARFNLTTGGALSFVTAPDYETPTDADANNVYTVQVTATDASGSATQTLNVTVTNVAAEGVGSSDDPYFSSVVFLSGFEGADASTAMVDEATAKAITVVGNAQLDTAQKKFGVSSLLLDGSGDYLTLADNPNWDFGFGPFTLEGWFRFAATPTNTILLAQWPSGWAWFFESGQLRFRPIGADTTPYAWAPTLNVWHHIAFDSVSGIARLYVNGAMVTKNTGYTPNISGSTSVLAIGSLTPGGFGGYDFNGWMDEVRITKGVARYASDAGFTVPTAAFPRTGPTPVLLSASRAGIGSAVIAEDHTGKTRIV